jgi:hypothetical protein
MRELNQDKIDAGILSGRMLLRFICRNRRIHGETVKIC